MFGFENKNIAPVQHDVTYPINLPRRLHDGNFSTKLGWMKQNTDHYL